MRLPLQGEPLPSSVHGRALPGAAAMVLAAVALTPSTAPDPFQYLFGIGLAVAALSLLRAASSRKLVRTLGAAGLVSALWSFLGWDVASWQVASLATLGLVLVLLPTVLLFEDE